MTNGFLEFGMLTLVAMGFMTVLWAWTLISDYPPIGLRTSARKGIQPGPGELEGALTFETIAIAPPKVKREVAVA